MYKLICLFIFAIMLIFPGCGTEKISEKGNTKYENFTGVKEILLKKIYNTHRITFYCGCTFDENKRVRCNVGESKRARRIEWEHVVPASQFGRTFSSWKKQESLTCRIPSFIRDIFSIKCESLSTRENARRVSKAYRLMESDMYNLVPAIGLVNQQRQNYPYGIIPGEKRAFGNCDFEVEAKKAEPAPYIRGDIARTYLYMNDAYPGRDILSDSEEKMFRVWEREDPVDKWECERCKKIESFQGNVNIFVKKTCQEQGLW